MLVRRFLCLLLIAPLAFFCPGCVLVPDHLSIGIERDESEANKPHRQRTATTKVDAHVVFDLRK